MEHAQPATQKPAPMPAGHTANSLAKLQIIPSGAAVGAEVRGIDLSQPIPG